MEMLTFFFEGNKYAKLYNRLWGGDMFYDNHCNRVTYRGNYSDKDRGYNNTIRDYNTSDHIHNAFKVVHFYEVKGKLYAQSKESLFKKLDKHV